MFCPMGQVRLALFFSFLRKNKIFKDTKIHELVLGLFRNFFVKTKRRLIPMWK